jgi:anti-anti-sigma regulatory factor
MFRITTDRAVDRVVLKLEGCLWGAWVGELDECWREVMKTLKGRPLLIDLTDLCSVDETGRRLLTLIYRDGAAFVASGCVMPEMVREISESADIGVGREN